ncbi:hypothetical protein ABZP36_014153 [Zizania latifolia]
MHALATHLLKLKLSERLFLENDILPEDLAVATEVNQIQNQYGTSVESDTNDTKDSLVHQKGVNIEDYGSNIHCDDKTETNCHSEGMKFEVVSAEEELDMLLNTVGGTRLYDLLSETSLSIKDEDFAEPGSTYKPTFNNEHNIGIKYANQIDITASIDDTVDDLLADTSLCLNGQKQTISALGQDNISSIHLPHSGPSNASDDFDSWFDSL